MTPNKLSGILPGEFVVSCMVFPPPLPSLLSGSGFPGPGSAVGLGGWGGSVGGGAGFVDKSYLFLAAILAQGFFLSRLGRPSLPCDGEKFSSAGSGPEEKAR